MTAAHLDRYDHDERDMSLPQPEPIDMTHGDSERLDFANRVIRLLVARAGKAGVTFTREELERAAPDMDRRELIGGGLQLTTRGSGS